MFALCHAVTPHQGVAPLKLGMNSEQILNDLQLTNAEKLDEHKECTAEKK